MVTAARRRVLDAVRRADPPVTVSALADELGLHPTTVRFHLDQLVAAGLATVAPTHEGVRGRPARRYRASPMATDPGHLTAEVWGPMVEALAATIDRAGAAPRASAIAAGRAWAQRLSPAGPDPVPRVFARLGFAPETAPWGLRLCACPFTASARHHPTICVVHLGLAQGLADAAGDPRPVSLIPFAEPGVCHLVLDPGASPPAGDTA